MPGLRIAVPPSDGNLQVEPFICGEGQTYRTGDLLVRTTLSTLLDADPPVSGGTAVRLLTSSDISALYETALNDIVGVLGIARYSAGVNSSGVATESVEAIPRAGGVATRAPIANVAHSLPTTPVYGRSMLDVEIITPDVWLGGTLVETTTVTEALIGNRVGFNVSVSSGISTYKFSTAAMTKIGTIVGVNTTHRLYNTTGGGGEVFVQIDNAYCQWLNGFNYAT